MLNPVRMLLAFGLMYLAATTLGFASYLIFSPRIMWLCVFLLMPVVAALLVWWYLDRVSCPSEDTFMETLKLVGAWMILSFALDAVTYVFLIPRLQHRPAAWMFFKDQSPWIWLSYAVLLASGLGGRKIFLYLESKISAAERSSVQCFDHSDPDAASRWMTR
jgi:hypothetical protein